MMNHILRDQAYINSLKDAIYQQYDITAIEITPAKRGYYGETWKVRGTAGVYFLKMDYLPFHQKRFAGGLSVIEYLCENGIDFVGHIIKTRDGRLCPQFDTALMGMFEWVDGENIEKDDTKAPEYQMMCKVYQLTKPGLGIPAASFSDDAAVRFYQQWDRLKSAPKTDGTDLVLSTFERFGGEIAHCALRLSQFAERCREDGGDFYLTHGDAGGNFFTGNGRNYIFDWDEAMYAPIERDAWVMGCYDWARKLFNDTLKGNHIPYQLRPERLAFYCYHMYFFYLGEFLKVHPMSDKSQRILEYFEDSWIKSRIKFADTL
nr:aminoglycoside phosphotransferase family protein [bacterium]